MISVVAMSSSDPLHKPNFNKSEVSSTSNNNIMDVTDCEIKREPDSEDSLTVEHVRDVKENSTDDINFQKENETLSLKSEFIKKDSTGSEDVKDSAVTRLDNTLPSSPSFQPKKSFMTSHILGNVDSTCSVSPICQTSSPVVVSTSSIACSIASPNDSNFSSNGASPNSSHRGSVCSPTNSINSKTTSPMSSPPSSAYPQTHLLFQPFLPFNQPQPHSTSHQSLLHHSSMKHQQSPTRPNVPQMVQRALPFSIDNILKPTFGRDGEETSSVASHLFSPFLGASLASSILQHHHQQNLLQQAAAAHAVNAAVSAAANSSIKENSFSSLNSGALGQYPGSAFNPRGGIISPSGSSLSSPRSPTYSSSSLPSMGTSKPKAFKVKQEPPPPARSPEKGTLPKDIIVRKNSTNTNQPVDLSKSSSGDENETKGKDDDVPPGMVRGPNGQLWPAWVFCTRYSDRPSSGKLKFCIQCNWNHII